MKRKTIALGCILVLSLSSCGLPSLWDTPPTPAITTTPTLQDTLKSIHDQFEIDPEMVQFALEGFEHEYHQALQQMTVLLLTDPRAQALSFAEREALFAKVTGFDGVRFIAGDGEATLVSLRTNRGLGIGSHDRAPDALHVVDQQGNIYDLGSVGLLVQTWWLDDRWIAHVQTGVHTGYGSLPMAVWHIGQTDGMWQRLLAFEFTPMPYYFDSPPLRFEQGYQVMIADLDYSRFDDPCEFAPEFKGVYESHGLWRMRRTYRLADNTYELTSSEILTFTVQRKDTGEQVGINWQDYCVGPIK